MQRVAWTGALTGSLVAAKQHGCREALRCDAGPAGLPSLEELAPLGGGVTLGTLLGLCSGFALKKAGKAAAIVFGGVFCLQQALAYKGYVTVNWPAVERDLTCLLDLNKDGVVDAKDLNHSYVLALRVLQHNALPISSGFGAGFLYGVKKG
mmetsp:Transcript_50851/g.145316  ORF Transcript_50851/g.145316 Transcript_50851/m.145316 type:complete len:151 (+) Transcript_50851:1-453(+)